MIKVGKFRESQGASAGKSCLGKFRELSTFLSLKIQGINCQQLEKDRKYIFLKNVGKSRESFCTSEIQEKSGNYTWKIFF